MHNHYDAAEAQTEIIINEIKEAKIEDFKQLESRIREIYIEENKMPKESLGNKVG